MIQLIITIKGYNIVSYCMQIRADAVEGRIIIRNVLLFVMCSRGPIYRIPRTAHEVLFPELLGAPPSRRCPYEVGLSIVLECALIANIPF